MGRDTMATQRLIGWQARWDKETRRLRFDRVYVTKSAPGTVRLPPALPPVVPYLDARQVLIETKTQKDTSHLFHLIMTLMTGGMWLVVWFLTTIWHKAGPRRTSVTTVTRRR